MKENQRNTRNPCWGSNHEDEAHNFLLLPVTRGEFVPGAAEQAPVFALLLLVEPERGHALGDAEPRTPEKPPMSPLRTTQLKTKRKWVVTYHLGDCDPPGR